MIPVSYSGKKCGCKPWQECSIHEIIVDLKMLKDVSDEKKYFGTIQ